MKFDPPTCPHCKSDPDGTIEELSALAEFEDECLEGHWEYSGNTEIFWDSQATIKHEGKMLLHCSGNKAPRGYCTGGGEWYATEV